MDHGAGRTRTRRYAQPRCGSHGHRARSGVAERRRTVARVRRRSPASRTRRGLGLRLDAAVDRCPGRARAVETAAHGAAVQGAGPRRRLSVAALGPDGRGGSRGRARGTGRRARGARGRRRLRQHARAVVRGERLAVPAAGRERSGGRCAGDVAAGRPGASGRRPSQGRRAGRRDGAHARPRDRGDHGRRANARRAPRRRPHPRRRSRRLGHRSEVDVRAVRSDGAAVRASMASEELPDARHAGESESGAIGRAGRPGGRSRSTQRTDSHGAQRRRDRARVRSREVRPLLSGAVARGRDSVPDRQLARAARRACDVHLRAVRAGRAAGGFVGHVARTAAQRRARHVRPLHARCAQPHRGSGDHDPGGSRTRLGTLGRPHPPRRTRPRSALHDAAAARLESGTARRWMDCGCAAPARIQASDSRVDRAQTPPARSCGRADPGRVSRWPRDVAPHPWLS